jgi:hypothetical protein
LMSRSDGVSPFTEMLGSITHLWKNIHLASRRFRGYGRTVLCLLQNDLWKISNTAVSCILLYLPHFKFPVSCCT